MKGLIRFIIGIITVTILCLYCADVYGYEVMDIDDVNCGVSIMSLSHEPSFLTMLYVLTSERLLFYDNNSNNGHGKVKSTVLLRNGTTKESSFLRNIQL